MTALEGIESLNSKDFETQIKNGVAMVDFGAPWCAPCRMQRPTIEQLAAQHIGKVMFAEVDVDENRQTAMEYGIMSIPTIILFKEGKEIQRFVGLQPANALSLAIEKALQ
jgi:thioredoxin 1